MTGYGIEETYVNGTHLIFEMKSVNHRFLDVKFNMPQSLNSIEPQLKEIVKQYFQRGKVDVYITIIDNSSRAKAVKTDWNLLEQYMEQFNLVSEKYNLDEQLFLNQLMTIPDLFSVQEDVIHSSELIDTLFSTAQVVCTKVIDMRQSEGDILINDIKKRINLVDNMLLLIEERRPTIINDYRNRILKRIEEYMESHMILDYDKLYQEIALLAEKGDISEEIVRVQSHIKHLHKTINLHEPIGRKLDFIVQELHREVNTVGSKATDENISQSVVNIKSELEKIKEQIQNIE